MKPWTEWAAEPGYLDFMVEVARRCLAGHGGSLMHTAQVAFTYWDSCVQTACDRSGGPESPPR